MLEARGGIDDVVEGQGIDLALAARGSQWGRLQEVFPDGLGPVSFPEIGPFDISANVRGDVTGMLAVDGIRAGIGFAETLSVSATGAVASAMDGGGIDIRADVTGQEFKDLIGLLRAPFRARRGRRRWAPFALVWRRGAM